MQTVNFGPSLNPVNSVNTQTSKVVGNTEPRLIGNSKQGVETEFVRPKATAMVAQTVVYSNVNNRARGPFVNQTVRYSPSSSENCETAAEMTAAGTIKGICNKTARADYGCGRYSASQTVDHRGNRTQRCVPVQRVYTDSVRFDGAADSPLGNSLHEYDSRVRQNFVWRSPNNKRSLHSAMFGMHPMNCWNTLRAPLATAWPVTASAKALKTMEIGQSAAAQLLLAGGSTTRATARRFQVEPKLRGTCLTQAYDIVSPLPKGKECKWQRLARKNSTLDRHHRGYGIQHVVQLTGPLAKQFANANHMNSVNTLSVTAQGNTEPRLNRNVEQGVTTTLTIQTGLVKALEVTTSAVVKDRETPVQRVGAFNMLDDTKYHMSKVCEIVCSTQKCVA